MERRRAHSASGMRPSSYRASANPTNININIPSTVNNGYYKPVLDSNRTKSSSYRDIHSAQQHVTNAVNIITNQRQVSNNTNYPIINENKDSRSTRPYSGNSSIGNRIRSALDHSYVYLPSSNETIKTMTNTTITNISTTPHNPTTYSAPATRTSLDSTGAGLGGIGVTGGLGEGMVSSNELEGVNICSSTTPHPEISSTLSSSTHKQHGIDVRSSNSLDDFPDDLINVDVGLSTIPNKYCTIREAIELKKLLILSKGSRGGIVPSSSAVMDMYMVGNVIGVGSYGKVRSAWHRLTGGKVAIKTYDKSRLKDQSHWKRVHSEIKITELVSHPRIARMYEAVETPKRLHLIMECIDGGNLCSYVKQKKKLTEMETKKIFYQLMLAIEYLYRENIAHRDIKLENVLFTETKDIKLIDFGFSTMSKPGTKMKIFCGTPSYMAPEIVNRTEYEGPPVDLWAAGVLLYACLVGQFPFRAQTYPDLYRRIARGSYTIPDELSTSVKDLLHGLLVIDPLNRLTPSDVLKHSWLTVQVVNAPDMSRLRHDTYILISENPNDDIDSQAIAEIVRFGISREEVIRLVMTKTHSSVATLYYLFLHAIMTTRAITTTINNNTLHTSNLLIQNNKMNKIQHGIDTDVSMRKEGGNDTPIVSTLATQFLLKSAGGAGVLNLRPRSASTSRATSTQARPFSANLARR